MYRIKRWKRQTMEAHSNCANKERSTFMDADLNATLLDYGMDIKSGFAFSTEMDRLP